MGKKSKDIILIIDDDEMNLQIAKMILERKLPCEVIGVDNGIAGIEILQSKPVRVVLLDIMMPEFDGIETLQEIRADERLKKIPVMMLTASGDMENIRKVRALGVTDYIRKPFMPADLIERVNKKLIETNRQIEKILLIGEQMQEIIEENFSCEVKTAKSFEDAIKILNEEKIILVMLSADTNFIDGFEILKFMASDEKFDEIPLAVSSADKLREIIDKLSKEDEPVEEKKSAPAEKLKESVDTVKTTSEKKKIANVVTNLIGYEVRI